MKAASRATLLLSGVAIVLFLVSDRLAAELSSPGAPGLRIAALIGGLATSGGWLGAMAVIRAGRRPTIRWLSLAALVPAPLFLVAAAHAGGAVAYGIGAAVVIGRAAGHRRQRDTDEGLRAASASAGSSGKGPSPTFRRPLSPCGSATSRTPRPSRSPPRRSGTCRWARTRIGGRGARTGGEWRLVRIRYPSFWPPAWGWRPRVALIVSVVGAVVASVALRLAAGIGWLEASAAHPPGLVALVRGLFVSFLTMGTILALWSLSTLARAVMDLGRPQERRGLVLRVRVFGRSSRSPGRHFVAVDDGRSPVVRAWRIRPEISSALGVSEYEEAVATVTRQLRFVDDLRRA